MLVRGIAHIAFDGACAQVDSLSAQAAMPLLTRLLFAVMRLHRWAVAHMCVHARSYECLASDL